MPTLYTAIIGKGDYLKPFRVKQRSLAWRYVCFTDQDWESSVFDLVRDKNPWEIRKVDVLPCGPVKTARHIKINFHRYVQDDVTMWIDGTFFVNYDLERWYHTYFKHDFTTIKHPFDSCLYVDAISCMKGDKGNRWEIIRQMQDYKNIGIPENNGLISSGILMRRRRARVIEACKMWWEQVDQYSERDQIAFGYVNWKMPGVHESIEWDYTTQKEFEHCPHRHKKWGEKRAMQMAGKMI